MDNNTTWMVCMKGTASVLKPFKSFSESVAAAHDEAWLELEPPDSSHVPLAAVSVQKQDKCV